MKYLLLVILLVGGYWLFRNDEPDRMTSEGKLRAEYWMSIGAHEEFPVSVKLFNESQDSIEVVPIGIPWKENEKKILTAILSGNPPDIIVQFSPVPRWASRRALMPLDDYIKRDNFDSDIFYPPLWEEMQWEGRVFALPSFGSCYGLFYNKRLFREAGLDPNKPPLTWEELSLFAEKLTIRDEHGRVVQAGFIPNYGNLAASIVQAYQKGAKFRSDDLTKVLMDEAPVVDALQWTVDYYDKYGLEELTALQLSFTWFGEQHGFNSERVAMVILDNSHVHQLRQYAPDLEYGIAQIPYGEGERPATKVGSFWFAIPRGAKSPEAAWAFMKFAVSKEAQLKGVLMQDEPLLPANRFVVEEPAFLAEMPQMKAFDKLMYHGFSSSVLPLVHDAFWREYNLAMEKALHHRQTAKEVLREANERLQTLLDQAIEYDYYVRKKMPL